MASSSQFRMADRLTGGRLGEIIVEGRTAGQSFEQIARGLFADYGVEVSQQTLSRWAAGLDLDTATATA